MPSRVWLSPTQWVWDDGIKYKDPNDVLDYAIDLADAGTNDGSDSDTGWLNGDTISSVAWTVPTGIVKDSDSHTATVATIWLSGGTAGTDYLVTARIVTAAGRTHDASMLIKVASG